MKIKEGKVIYLGDDPFWYDVTCGHLAPEDTLENVEDIERVKKAVEILEEYEKSLAEAGEEI